MCRLNDAYAAVLVTWGGQASIPTGCTLFPTGLCVQGALRGCPICTAHDCAQCASTGATVHCMLWLSALLYVLP